MNTYTYIYYVYVFVHKHTCIYMILQTHMHLLQQEPDKASDQWLSSP